MFNLKNLAFVALALILGFIGLSLAVSDIGTSESAASRIFVAASFFFLCGVGIGYLNPLGWTISGSSAWGSVLLGAFLTLAAVSKYWSGVFSPQAPPSISAGLIILLAPLILALLGG